MDTFFTKYTFIGDGLFSILIIVLLLFINKPKEALCLLIAFLSSGIVAQALKNIFSMPRPKLYFEQQHILYNNFVEGITLCNNNSFPSGHTTSAFALATIIVLVSTKKRIQLSAFIVAMLAGYSRMYLGQHFLQDIVAGAFIGVCSALGAYYIIWYKPFNLSLIIKRKRYQYLLHEEISPIWS